MILDRFGLSLLSIIAFLLLILTALPSNASPDDNDLVKTLFANYNRHIRPSRFIGDVTNVTFYLTLLQLISVTEKSEEMTTSQYVTLKWEDPRLTWKPKDHKGITQLRLASHLFWKPDLVLHNNNDGKYDTTVPVNALLNHTGMVEWLPAAIYKSACQIKVDLFPFDWQNCTMKFRSFTYDKTELYITSTYDKVVFDKQAYMDSGEWKIIHCPIRTNEDPNDPRYQDISLHLIIQRKPLFYVINIIVPCVLISSLSVMVFYLPSGSSEKMTMSISVLLGLTVYLLLLAKRVPETSLGVPLIGAYLLFTMLTVTLSIIFSVIVLNTYHRTPSTSEMPPWVQELFMERLPLILRMKRPFSTRQMLLEETQKNQYATFDKHQDSCSTKTNSCPEVIPDFSDSSLPRARRRKKSSRASNSHSCNCVSESVSKPPESTSFESVQSVSSSNGALLDEGRVHLPDDRSVYLPDDKNVSMSDERNVSMTEKNSFLPNERGVLLPDENKVYLTNESKFNLSDENKVNLPNESTVDFPHERNVLMSHRRRVFLSNKRSAFSLDERNGFLPDEGKVRLSDEGCVFPRFETYERAFSAASLKRESCDQQTSSSSSRTLPADSIQHPQEELRAKRSASSGCVTCRNSCVTNFDLKNLSASHELLRSSIKNRLQLRHNEHIARRRGFPGAARVRGHGSLASRDLPEADQGFWDDSGAHEQQQSSVFVYRTHDAHVWRTKPSRHDHQGQTRVRRRSARPFCHVRSPGHRRKRSFASSSSLPVGSNSSCALLSSPRSAQEKRAFFRASSKKKTERRSSSSDNGSDTEIVPALEAAYNSPAPLLPSTGHVPEGMLIAANAVGYIAENMKTTDRMKVMIEDWHFVAAVLDRLLLWVFTIIFVFGTMYFFLKALLNAPPDHPFYGGDPKWAYCWHTFHDSHYSLSP